MRSSNGQPGSPADRRSDPRSAGQPRDLAQPIVPGLPDLLAEVALAARREQARSVGDVLLRRTRLGLLAARELPVQRVADVLARELGWSAADTDREVERFAREARAEGIEARELDLE
jgi:glycerol-3-phosphate dehydrogenase